MAYPMGMDLVEKGGCPVGMRNPLACWFCTVRILGVAED